MKESYIYKKPKLFTYVLHILHMHPIGIHFLILPLNCNNEVDSLISVGIRAQVFGPLKYMVSCPLRIERTLLA